MFFLVDLIEKYRALCAHVSFVRDSLGHYAGVEFAPSLEHSFVRRQLLPVASSSCSILVASNEQCS